MSGLSRQKLVVALMAVLAAGAAPLFLRWSVQETLLSLMICSALTVGIVETLPREQLRGLMPLRALLYGALMVFSVCVIVGAALS